MLYLNENHLLEIGKDWEGIIETIEQSVNNLSSGDFTQPIKPYLRYKDLSNRIIAMPAYAGGDIDFAGIKWIASFPKNIDKNVKRANSITILNESETGIPKCIINGALISGIRTAGVTAFVLNKWIKNRLKIERLNVGICGFGPVGRLHLDMVQRLLGEKLENLFLYDIRGVDKESIDPSVINKVKVCENWEQAYQDADIFITCTVSDKPYVNKPPKSGSLHLNVSLRDYVWEFMKFVDVMIVDNWEEVCRENTDIEMMHKKAGLMKESTYSIEDILEKDIFSSLEDQSVVMFNPMGMAVFDIAIGKYYYQQASNMGVGINLED